MISGYYGDSKIIAETASKLRIGVHALVGLANAAYSNPRFIAENRELTDQLFDGNYWHNPQSPRATRGVRRLPEALQLDHVQPRRAGLPGDRSCSRTRWSGPARPTATRCATRSAKTNLTDHILTQDAIRFDDAGENVNAIPALLQVQNGKPVVVGPRALRGGQAGVPGPQVEGLGAAGAAGDLGLFCSRPSSAACCSAASTGSWRAGSR